MKPRRPDVIILDLLRELPETFTENDVWPRLPDNMLHRKTSVAVGLRKLVKAGYVTAEMHNGKNGQRNVYTKVRRRGCRFRHTPMQKAWAEFRAGKGMWAKNES